MPSQDNIPDELVTTYLHMTDETQFKPAFQVKTYVRIDTMQQVDVSFYLFLYRSVGEAWHWRDRLLISRDELGEILARPQTSVYVLYADGVPGGFIELEQQGDDIEVAYFGLRAAFIGRGLGKHLLSFGVQRAWEQTAKRVWLHTCNLDGPYALANYQARGFQVYDVIKEPMPQRYL